MKHKRSVLSIAMASIMLVSLCAVVSTTSVSAAPSSSATVQSALASAPAGVVGAPALVSASSTQFELFVRGTDNALWWRHIPVGGTWSAWENLGGVLTSSPSVTVHAYGDGYLYVYVRGTNGALYTKRYNYDIGFWTDWRSEGGQLLAGTGPGVCNMDNLNVMFVVGTNHQLYQKVSGSDWTSLGGYLTSSPAAVSRAAGKIDVFARGSNGALYQRWTADGRSTWSNWQNLGGQLLAGTDPGVCAWDANHMGVFLTGTNNAIYWKKFDGSSWTAWTSLGGILTSGPAAASRTTNAIDMCARGSNGKLYLKWTDNGGTTWSNWLAAPA